MRTLIVLLAATALAGCDDSANEPAAENGSVLPAENEDPALVDRGLEGMEPLGDERAGGSEPVDDFALDARTRYATYYLGSYGPDAKCGGDNDTLELQQDAVRYGATTCQIGSLEGDGPQVRINGESCMTDGTKSANTNYVLSMTEMQALDLQTGSKNVSLKRCATT